jgi:hypothetical protein
MSADVSELLLCFGREVGLETMCRHDLPRDCLEVDGRRVRIVHCVPLSRNNELEKANMNCGSEVLRAVAFPVYLRAPCAYALTLGAEKVVIS